VTHADGTITKGGAKVVKNATAYDITKLYLGAHGTLGVILEATLRVYPAGGGAGLVAARPRPGNCPGPGEPDP
jgi:glycolate oxidase FAD binding subunit